MVTGNDIKGMLNHWLHTKPNSYRGSDYGAPLSSLLLHATSTNVSNSFIEKMKKDIPILNQLSSNQFGIYFSDLGFEKKTVILKVGVIEIDLSGIDQNSQIQMGETYNVDAS